MTLGSQISDLVEKMAAAAGARSTAPAAFALTGEGSAADCLTVAAALLGLPLPAGWAPLAARAAALIGPGASAPEAEAQLASLQAEVRRYLKDRLGDRYPAPRAADGGMPALLAALMAEEAEGKGGRGGRGGEDGARTSLHILPAYRVDLRGARGCGWRGDAARGPPQQRCEAGVALEGADVAVRDAILHAQRSRFDLQKCLWSCAALHGGTAAGAPPPCPNPDCASGLCLERLEATELPKWLLVQLRREPGKAHFSVPGLALTEARLGPDLDGCATLELPKAGGQLATFDLRAVFATDRDHHCLAFLHVPHALERALGLQGWCSYGIYADGRLAPAGGPGAARPDILDGHSDEDPSNITCLLFEQRPGPATPPAAAAGAQAATDAGGQDALAAAAVAGFVAGLDTRRLQRCAEGAGLGAVDGRRGAMEPRVAAHLLPDVLSLLGMLGDTPLPELQERCAAAGLDRQGGAAALRVRLALRKLQERFDLA